MQMGKYKRLIIILFQIEIKCYYLLQVSAIFSFYVIIQIVSQTGPHFYADNKLSQKSDPLKALC